MPTRLISSRMVCSTSNTSCEPPGQQPWTSWLAEVMSTTLKQCAKGQEAPAAKNSPSLRPPPRTPLVTLHDPAALEAAPHWGRCFPLPPLAQCKTPFTAREECRVQRSTSHLAGTPDMPQGSSLSDTSGLLRLLRHHCAAYKQINVLKCLLSQQ